MTSSNPVAGERVRRRRRRPEGHRRGLGRRPRPTPRASAPARSRPSSTTSSATRCARPAASTARPPAAPRRVGWLDLVALRYAARHQRARPTSRSPSSTCSAASTRCRSARATAAPTRRASTTSRTTSRCCTTPCGEYEELPGWDEDITDCRDEHDLPAGRARLPRLHRRLRRRAGRADRRRPRPRAGHLDRGGHARPPPSSAPRSPRPSPRHRSACRRRSRAARGSRSSHERPQDVERGCASPNVTELSDADEQHLDGDLAQHRAAERHRLAVGAHDADADRPCGRASCRSSGPSSAARRAARRSRTR